VFKLESVIFLKLSQFISLGLLFIQAFIHSTSNIPTASCVVPVLPMAPGDSVRGTQIAFAEKQTPYLGPQIN
jgi:hypothetical protein